MPSVAAPYVETDKRMLGDSHLSPEESVIREREKCLKQASQFRLYGQDELEDPDRACGSRLQYTELVSKLRRIAPQLVFLEGSPGNLAVYAPRDAKDYAATLREWDPEHKTKNDAFFKRYRYVGGIPKREIQEYDTVTLDTSLLVTRTANAWRSLLISMIKQAVFSYADAVAEFGDVGTDRRGWRWREQLHPWRQAGSTKFKQQTQENRNQ